MTRGRKNKKAAGKINMLHTSKADLLLNTSKRKFDGKFKLAKVQRFSTGRVSNRPGPAKPKKAARTEPSLLNRLQRLLKPYTVRYIKSESYVNVPDGSSHGKT